MKDTGDGFAENQLFRTHVSIGSRKFQLKVGGSAKDDIDRIIAVRKVLDSYVRAQFLPSFSFHFQQLVFVFKQTENGVDGVSIPLLCDANTGWLRHEAMQVVNGG